MQLFLCLAAFVAVAFGKCRSKCKAEYVDCITIHGEDVETRVLDACIKTKAKDEDDTDCSKCLGENTEGEPVSVQRQFICLTKCKWVAIGCTKAGVNASNLLKLMQCVSSSYNSELNRKRAPLCGQCIRTGECAKFCNDRKEGDEPCTDEEIDAVMEPCQKAKAGQDHCAKNNVRNCESLPICQLCNGECIDSSAQCVEEGVPVKEPTPAPQKGKGDQFKDLAAYLRYCKVNFKGKEKSAGCIKCGGKPQVQKGGCKVSPKKAVCNRIEDPDICKKAKCKASWNDKGKTDFKRCVNPTDGTESIFGGNKKKSRRGRR